MKLCTMHPLKNPWFAVFVWLYTPTISIGYCGTEMFWVQYIGCKYEYEYITVEYEYITLN